MTYVWQVLLWSRRVDHVHLCVVERVEPLFVIRRRCRPSRSSPHGPGACCAERAGHVLLMPRLPASAGHGAASVAPPHTANMWRRLRQGSFSREALTVSAGRRHISLISGP